MWFDIIKYKSIKGSIPHFYQYLSRVFKNKSQHTSQYLDKYLGWDEVPKDDKEFIKTMLERTNPDEDEEPDTWSGYRNRIGVKVIWDDLDNPTLDRDYYNKWRESIIRENPDKANPQSTTDWRMTHAQDREHRVIKTLLKRKATDYDKQWARY